MTNDLPANAIAVAGPRGVDRRRRRVALNAGNALRPARPFRRTGTAESAGERPPPDAIVANITVVAAADAVNAGGRLRTPVCRRVFPAFDRAATVGEGDPRGAAFGLSASPGHDSSRRCRSRIVPDMSETPLKSQAAKRTVFSAGALCDGLTKAETQGGLGRPRPLPHWPFWRGLSRTEGADVIGSWSFVICKDRKVRLSQTTNDE